MKVAPVIGALSQHRKVKQMLVHTGQHYDEIMSDVFFRQLGLPQPDINLEVGLCSHTEQMAQIMMRFEPVALEQRPDIVLVYGDVNSTLAAAMVCAKLHIPVGHVEAGLRSFDRAMPEEINRLLTDQIADMLFTPSQDGNDNLLREGIENEKIHLVGNVMIDTLVRLLPKAELSLPMVAQSFDRFALLTLHRPSSVDNIGVLSDIVKAIAEISLNIPVIFPVHPRTKKNVGAIEIKSSRNNLHIIEPLGYLDFLALERKAAFVITDSGGVQEETTFLDVPCLTIRKNTERPMTVAIGTNIVIGHDMDRLRCEVAGILDGRGKRGKVPPLWDGKASERIADVIMRL